MRRLRLALAAPVACLVAAASGSAYGYWVVAAQGTTMTDSSTMVAGAATAVVGTATADLYPGGDGVLVLEVHNPNAFDVSVVAIAPSPDPATSDPVECAAYVSVNVDALPPTTPVAADGTVTVAVPDAVHLDVAAPTACQGASFTVPVLVTVER